MAELSLYNTDGYEVSKLTHTEGQQHSISHLDAGMYFVKLRAINNKETKTLKMLKVD